MTMAWESSLSGNEKLIALALADWSHDDGSHVFPSIESVAMKCGLSRRTVQYIFRRFEAEGLLILVSKENSDYRPTREYRINLNALNRIGKENNPCNNRAHENSAPMQSDRHEWGVNPAPNPPLSLEPLDSPPIVPPSSETSGENHLKMMQTEWNGLAEELGLQKIVAMPSRRARSATARWKDLGKEGWDRVLSTLRKERFYHGENDRKWKATFDYVVRQDAFTKLLEKSYLSSDQPVYKPESVSEYYRRLGIAL